MEGWGDGSMGTELVRCRTGIWVSSTQTHVGRVWQPACNPCMRQKRGVLEASRLARMAELLSSGVHMSPASVSKVQSYHGRYLTSVSLIRVRLQTREQYTYGKKRKGQLVRVDLRGFGG